MSERFARYAVAPALAALLVALGGITIAETLRPKDQPPPAPQLLNDPRFQYIHCATDGGDGPCGLDPAMQHLDGVPPLNRLKEMPPPVPLIRPDIAPAR